MRMVLMVDLVEMVLFVLFGVLVDHSHQQILKMFSNKF